MYADDLVIITESLEELEGKYTVWKSCMESKGLQVNLAKTMGIISDINQGPTFTSGKHPFRACYKGVGFNSIIYNDYAHCVHKQCSGVSDSLDNVVNFKCRTCLNPPVTNDEDKKFKLDSVDYEISSAILVAC